MLRWISRWWWYLGAAALMGIIILQPFTPYTASGAFVALLCGGFIAGVLKICSWVTGRQERRRLLADANAQNAWLNAGFDYAGTFGRFPPTS